MRFTVHSRTVGSQYGSGFVLPSIRLQF